MSKNDSFKHSDFMATVNALFESLATKGGEDRKEEE